MHLSEQETHNLYKQALSINERLNLLSSFQFQSGENALQEKKDKWCQVVADGEEANFEKRFIWCATSTERLQTVLNDFVARKYPSPTGSAY
jgi:hypothetical protein